MKKRTMLAAFTAAVLVGAGALFAASACAEESKPETATVRWARGNSGNALVTVALRLGYFKEYGLDVQEIHMDSGSGTALIAGSVDIVSNNGTNLPLSEVAAGNQITMFCGHMLTGCMPIIAREGTEWKGIESFVGKKIACPPNQFALTGALLCFFLFAVFAAVWLTHIRGQGDKSSSWAINDQFHSFATIEEKMEQRFSCST